jgi:hypothetical protein
MDFCAKKNVEQAYTGSKSNLEKTLDGPDKLLSVVHVADEGKRVEVLNQYTKRKETVNLNIRQRLALAIRCYEVKESVRRYEGWRDTPFYLFKYRENGKTYTMLDYHHGHDDHFHIDFLG